MKRAFKAFKGISSFGDKIKNLYKAFISYIFGKYEAVSSGYVTDGVELVVNDNYILQGSAVIESDGFINVDGSEAEWYNFARQSIVKLSDIGTKYKGVATIEAGTQGGLYIGCGGQAYVNNSNITENIIIENVLTVSTEGLLNIQSRAGFNGRVKFSFKKIIKEPNKVYGKNFGSAKLPSKFFSGNPYDFQGGQYIENVTGLEVNTPSDMAFCCSFIFYNDATTFRIQDYITATQSNRQFLLQIVNGDLVIYNGTSFEFIASLSVNTQHSIALNYIHSLGKIEVYSNSFEKVTLNISYDFSTVYNTIIASNNTGAFYHFNGQMDYMIKLSGNLSNTELTKQFQYPNDFYQDMKNDDRTLFCTDFRGKADVPYIADDKNLSKTLLTVPVEESSFTSTLNFNPIVASISLNNGNIKLTDNVTTTDSPRFRYKNADNSYFTVYATKTYLVVSKLINPVNIGGYAIRYGADASLNIPSILYQTDISNDESIKYTIVQPQTDGSIGIVSNGLSEGCSFEVARFDVYEISGVHLIQGHSPTCRTNFVNESTGIQDITRLFDDLGFFLQNVDYLNLPKDNISKRQTVDTGLLIDGSKDFTIWIVASKGTALGYYQLSGAKGVIGNANRLYLGYSIDRSILVRVGSLTASTITSNNDTNLIGILWNSTTKKFTLKVNQDFSYLNDDSVSDFEGLLNTFTLGNENGGSHFEVFNPILDYGFDYKYYTDEEWLKIYSKYEAQGILQ